MPSGSGNADFRAGPSEDQKAAAARQRQQLVADLQQQVCVLTHRLKNSLIRPEALGR